MNDIQILGPLVAIHQYDGLLSALAKLGYKANVNIFSFDYDWRLSNFENARRLGAFISGHIGDSQDFDMLVHSMGGLVARIYLNGNPEQSRRVHKVIYMGTPFLGSANTFGALSNGWGVLASKLAGGMDSIRTVLLSMPGFIELLPRYSECCYVRQTDGMELQLNIFDSATWRERGWLPSGIRDAAELQTFQDNLSRAARLDAIVGPPLPSNIREVKIVGDAHATRYFVGMPASATGPNDWKYTNAGGDGTVPQWSAANNRSLDSIEGTFVSFAEHGTIFDDATAQEELSRELTSPVPPHSLAIAAPANPSIEVIDHGTAYRWTVEQVELAVQGATIEVGDAVSAVLRIEFKESNVRPHLYRVAGSVESKQGRASLQASETTTEEDLNHHRLVFHLCGYTAEAAGPLEISVPLGQMTARADMLVMQ